jgi:hypothetical protein
MISGFRRAARGGLTGGGAGDGLGIRRGRLDRATALRIQRARAARAGTTRTARTTAAGTARTAAATTAAAAAIIGERLAIGTEARAGRGPGLPVGAEARAARGQGLTVGAEARAARGQGLAVGAEARAARAAGAARATSVAVAAGAAGATAIAAITARAAAARTAAVVARIARRAGQLPADAGAGHLAARGAVVVATLAFLRTAALVADGLEAAEAARLVATAGAAEAAATTAAAATATAGTTAIAAAATAVVATTAAAVIAAAAALRRTRNAVHRVVVLADGRGAGRALLALEDADESHRLDVGADDVERLDQALRAVGRDGDLAGDALGEGLALEALCRLGSAGGGSATEKESRELGQRLHGNEPWRAGACLTPSRARLATGLWRKASPGALASATTRCGITPASGSVSCTHPGNRNNAENGDGVTPRP